METKAEIKGRIKLRIKPELEGKGEWDCGRSGGSQGNGGALPESAAAPRRTPRGDPAGAKTAHTTERGLRRTAGATERTGAARRVAEPTRTVTGWADNRDALRCVIC